MPINSFEASGLFPRSLIAWGWEGKVSEKCVELSGHRNSTCHNMSQLGDDAANSQGSSPFIFVR